MAWHQEPAVNVKYELPPILSSLREGWFNTLTSSAVVSTLFSGIQSQFLGTIQTAVGQLDSTLGAVLLTFFYIAFFLSVSATISSVILTDEFSEIDIRAARKNHTDEETLHYDLQYELYEESTIALLSRFNGGRRAWTWVMWHWILSLVIGSISFVMQLTLYACVVLPHANLIFVLFLAGFTLLPLFHFFPLGQFALILGKKFGYKECA